MKWFCSIIYFHHIIYSSIRVGENGKNHTALHGLLGTGCYLFFELFIKHVTELLVFSLTRAGRVHDTLPKCYTVPSVKIYVGRCICTIKYIWKIVLLSHQMQTHSQHLARFSWSAMYQRKMSSCFPVCIIGLEPHGFRFFVTHVYYFIQYDVKCFVFTRTFLKKCLLLRNRANTWIDIQFNCFTKRDSYSSDITNPQVIAFPNASRLNRIIQ